MIDLLKFVYPNVSMVELTNISNFCVFLGGVLSFLGILSIVVESIGQKKVFLEGFPLVFLGLFFIIPMGMHSNISFSSFFYCIQLLIPIS